MTITSPSLKKELKSLYSFLESGSMGYIIFVHSLRDFVTKMLQKQAIICEYSTTCQQNLNLQFCQSNQGGHILIKGDYDVLFL